MKRSVMNLGVEDMSLNMSLNMSVENVNAIVEDMRTSMNMSLLDSNTM